MDIFTKKIENAFNIGQSFLRIHISDQVDYQKWLALIGLTYFGWKGLRSLRFLYTSFLRPRRNLTRRYGQGSWVLVAGASGGLGKAFCESFAKAGFNIILLGRNKEKLESTVQSIRSKNSKIQTRVLVTDLQDLRDTTESIDLVLRSVQGLDISILVNSVGITDNDFFHNRTDKSLIEEITVNCTGPATLTRKLVPQLLSRSSRSAIINISSQFGVRPTPYMIPYGCSTSFLDLFTQSVQKEIGHKVDVVSCTPYLLKTNIMFNKEYSGDSISPEQCAKSIIDSLGYDSRTAGHWKHKLVASAFDHTPQFLYDKLSHKIGSRYIEWRKVHMRRV